MKKIVKRFLELLMVAMLVLAMSITAFASEEVSQVESVGVATTSNYDSATLAPGQDTTLYVYQPSFLPGSKSITVGSSLNNGNPSGNDVYVYFTLFKPNGQLMDSWDLKYYQSDVGIYSNAPVGVYSVYVLNLSSATVDVYAQW